MLSSWRLTVNRRGTDVVETEPRTAFEEFQVVVQVGIAIAVTNRDTREVGAFIREDRELLESDLAKTRVGNKWQSRHSLGARRRAMNPLLHRGHPRLLTPNFTNNPGPDTGFAHTVDDLSNQLLG